MSEVDLGLLISLIEGRSVLYNKRNPSYKNNTIKDNCWREVAEVMGIAVGECQRFWKNLRDAHTRDLRNINKQPSGSEAEQIITVSPYYNAMAFLDNYIQPRRTVSNILPLHRPSSSNNSDSVENSLSGAVSPPPHEVEDNLSGFETDLPSETNESVTSKVLPAKSVKIMKASKPSKNKGTMAAEVLVETAKEIAGQIKKKYNEEEKTEKQCVNEAFARYLVLRLNGMDKGDATMKRRRIFEILED